VRDVSVLRGEGDPLCIAFDGEVLAVGTSSGAVVAWNVAEGYAAWKGYHGGAVAAIASVPGAGAGSESSRGGGGGEGGGKGRGGGGSGLARLISGGADGMVLLWDREGRVQARLEVGAGVTALTAPTPRTAGRGLAVRTPVLIGLSLSLSPARPATVALLVV